MGKGGRSRAGGGGGGPLSAHCASCTFGWACCIFLVEGLIAVVRRLRDGIIALRDLERNYVTLGVQHVRPGRCCWCFFFFFFEGMGGMDARTWVTFCSCCFPTVDTFGSFGLFRYCVCCFDSKQ